VERFAAGTNGELEPITADSIRAVVETRRHAGITPVTRYTFSL
jgi:hypothetical protein